MMHVKLVLCLAAATLVTAENIVTTTLFIPDTDAESLAGSVMGVAATATTYFVNCPTATGVNEDDDDDDDDEDDEDDCGMGPGMTIVAGPRTTSYLMGEPADDFYMSMACSVQGITYGVCTEMISGTGADFPGTYTTTMGTDDLCCFVPVTITAGTLTGGAGDATSSATVLAAGTATATTTNASATGTGPATSDNSVAATASTTTHNSTTQSTGAAALLTFDSTVIVGGAVAAALVVAAL
ncbi:hypothetical protein BO86DRAFT_412108 [Aspergillus japonicus CBS 114.51]|uniref:GPI anchored protein n=1 Tax=Aspergillus japonicus CBS 114.51 TaxID=1448312 RepID=A0A8T8WTJ1_ASPJA|nr:hypothetical protein BO86DRAFT_412108 [Aspergillus japonicus CBS 114.51]RAH78812.1 hypothetical protein BO86DRAFT_412108 [Aspergillus japonicus CBS 114.51]